MLPEVISCVTQEHDHTYLLVAALVCLAGSATTTSLFANASKLSDPARRGWFLLASLAGGTAIWTTHFVAMLGFDPGQEHSYDVMLTVGSLLIAMMVTASGLWIAAAARSSIGVAAGGLVLGLGISAMHYTGIAGYEVAARREWDAAMVSTSIALGGMLGAATTALASRGRPVFSWLAAGALALAICTMHFTAMGALTFVPDPRITVSPLDFSSETIALIVLAVMSGMTGVGLYVIETRSQRTMVENFRQLALRDTLTELPNRRFLSTTLPSMIEEAEKLGSQLAVVMFDLDRFKEINDVHGHSVGDMLLNEVGARLKVTIRDGELVARVGGDEFVAVKAGISGPDEAIDFAKRPHDRLAEPFRGGGRILTIGASLGISLFPRDGHDAEELVGIADLAMYRTKKTGHMPIALFDPSIDESQRNRMALSIELAQALEGDELELYYQPQVNVESGDVVGFEALLRWHHRERGMVQPGDFIPIAEETGLILPVGEWVLRRACHDAAEWRWDWSVSVNVASAQLSGSDLPSIVAEALRESGLAPSRLELELTEASVIEDRTHTLSVLRQIRAFGVSIVMDDYGTGYSSLSTLQTFPFDKLKIDRSFVSDLTESRQSAAIVKATILLSRELGLSVVAEGVETAEQLAFLSGEGCTEAQGYFFGKPQPASEAIAATDAIQARRDEAEAGTGQRNRRCALSA